MAVFALTAGQEFLKQLLVTGRSKFFVEESGLKSDVLFRFPTRNMARQTFRIKRPKDPVQSFVTFAFLSRVKTFEGVCMWRCFPDVERLRVTLAALVHPDKGGSGRMSDGIRCRDDGAVFQPVLITLHELRHGGGVCNLLAPKCDQFEPDRFGRIVRINPDDPDLLAFLADLQQSHEPDHLRLPFAVCHSVRRDDQIECWKLRGEFSGFFKGRLRQKDAELNTGFVELLNHFFQCFGRIGPLQI